MVREHKFKGVYTERRGKWDVILTKSIAPGKDVYGEEIIIDKEKREEYRVWDPSKSKLCSAMIKGISQIGIKPGFKVLYLGVSTGTTTSHVSDIVGKEGTVYGVEFAPRMMREFIFFCEDRKNIIPILADANHPERYMSYVLEVDTVYQDIAQRNQTEVFLKNCNMFLKDGGFGLLCVKARSIDVTKRPKDIFKEVKRELEKKVTIVDYRELDPFQKDHCIFVCKKK